MILYFVNRIIKNINYYIICSESITDETVITTKIETVEDLEKLKYELPMSYIDDSFDKLIV